MRLQNDKITLAANAVSGAGVDPNEGEPGRLSRRNAFLAGVLGALLAAFGFVMMTGGITGLLQGDGNVLGALILGTAAWLASASWLVAAVRRRKPPHLR